MSTLMHDLRHTVRQLRRQPVFAMTAVLTLGIGLGVNAVAFTVVNGLFGGGPPIEANPRAGRIITTPATDEGGNASIAEYERFAEATRGALALGAEGRLSVAWRHDTGTETAWVLFVSPNYFSLVPAEPLAGRVHVARVPGGAPSVVIGERFWREKLGRASIAGLTLRLNDTIATVAGVVPESFRGPSGVYSPDVWLPLEDLRLFRTSSALDSRETRWLFLLGIVEPGVELPAVQGRIASAAAAMSQEWPDTHAGRGARFRRFSDGNGERRALTIAAAAAMGIIGVVLLLACFNVANLLLARAIERERDMAIRAAVGASRLHLMRLVIIEGLVLSALAAAAALGIARSTQWLVGSFAMPIDVPQHIDLEPDAAVVGFVIGLGLIAGILPGVWPAVTAARVDVLRALGGQGGRAAGGRPSPMRRWLVGAQIAGSTAFLAIALLFTQSYGRMSLADLGLARGELLVAEIEPGANGYDADRSERYIRALMTRTRALPGVVDVAVADRAPFFIGYDRLTAVATAASPCDGANCPSYATLAVGPGYFRTLGVTLSAGREFEADAPRAEAIVNQPLAAVHWPDGGGLGETLRVGPRGLPVTVVGITAPTRTRTVDRERPTLYLPIESRHFADEVTIVARTSLPPSLVVRPFVEAATALDPQVAVRSAKPMDSRIAVQLWPFRTVSWLFAICGGLALLLATVGLAGVLTHAAQRRVREFGIRLSIGGTPRDLVVEVMRGCARLLVPGLIAGILMAAAAARLLQSTFVGVNALDPSTYAAVALLEATIVALACAGPALRAARVDPIEALRTE